MKGVPFPEANFDFKKPEGWTDNQCYELPTFRGEQYILKESLKPGEILDPEKLGPDEKFPVIISCWELSAEEMEQIQRTGKVWLIVTSRSFSPTQITTAKPSFDGTKQSDEKQMPYPVWLTNFIRLGQRDAAYTREGIIHWRVSPEHIEIVYGYWQADQTPAEALENYKKFILTLN